MRTMAAKSDSDSNARKRTSALGSNGCGMAVSIRCRGNDRTRRDFLALHRDAHRMTEPWTILFVRRIHPFQGGGDVGHVGGGVDPALVEIGEIGAAVGAFL